MKRQLMRRLLLVALLCLLTTMEVFAVKASPLPAVVLQPDGTRLTVCLHGDEDQHYSTTTDGVLLVRESDGYYVANVLPGAMLVSSGVLAHDPGQRSKEEQRLAAAQDLNAFAQAADGMAERRRARREPVATSSTMFPHSGSPKAVVILVDFPDRPFTIDNPSLVFDEYFNGEGKLPDHGFGERANQESVASYFATASFGQFTPQFDVYGPLTMPKKLSTYGGERSDGYDEDMDSLFYDACMLMDSTIDFSKYDANGDGFADLVIILYAGYSQSMGGNSNDCIWPKSGALSVTDSFDGIKLKRYAVSAELNGYPGCWSNAPLVRINGIGTLCHELCHTLGLPDFYPTGSAGKTVKGNNQAMEFWSLMDSGNYLNNGYTPVALNAWEREALGWIDIPNLTAAAEYEMKSIDEGGNAYRILNDNDESHREYFIIENIQQVGLNTYQKGHGLLVYHVDYDPSLFSLSGNKANNTKGRPRMTVVPADGLLLAQYNIGKKLNGDTVAITFNDFYSQLEGDPFPGKMNVSALNDTMQLVNFKVYKGEGLNKALDQIAESADGVVTFRFIADFDAHLHPFTKGDVNHDRKVDVVDVMLIVDHILGKDDGDKFHASEADVDGNTTINVTDAMSVVGIILRKE